MQCSRLHTYDFLLTFLLILDSLLLPTQVVCQNIKTKHHKETCDGGLRITFFIIVRHRASTIVYCRTNKFPRYICVKQNTN